MNTQTEREFALRVLHRLNQGIDAIEPGIAERLFLARRDALAHQATAQGGLSLAGFGQMTQDLMLPKARALFAVIGLAIAVAGVSFWNSVEKVAELEEIDSALLADDLPINAYLDKGFQAWISEHSSQD